MKKDYLRKVLRLFFILFFIICANNTFAQDFSTFVKKDLVVGNTNENKEENIILSYPTDVVIDSQKNIYVIDSYFLYKFNNLGKLIFKKEFLKGKGPGEFIEPYDLTYINEHIYILDHVLERVSILDQKGNYLNSFQIPFLAYKLSKWKKKYLILLGEYNENIFHVFTTKGKYKYGFGNPFSRPPNLKGLTSSGMEWYVNFDTIYAISPFKSIINKYIDKKLSNTYFIKDINISPPKGYNTRTGAITFIFPSGINGIVAYKNKLFITTFKVIPKPSKYYFYIYNMENKKLIKVFKIKYYLKIARVDSTGKFYLLGTTYFMRVKIK
ncbi:hypothetical protein BMS3Bbin03_01533 [bacterium BMS3Bbin03]|nr:hypothetical protein BMS3Bbin03_01533 [bacterium BMS3Bbin03]